MDKPEAKVRSARWLVFVVAGQLLLVGCGHRSPDNERQSDHIVQQNPDISPYLAVGMLEAPNGSCTGTLISKTDVLTAAHCVAGVSADEHPQIRFVLGGELHNNRYVSLDGQRCAEGRGPIDEGCAIFRAREGGVHIHPMYVADPIYFDIAIINLATSPSVPPMMASARSVVLGQPIRPVGYGITAGTANDYGVQRATDNVVAFVDREIFDSEMGTSGGGTCNGDSGGPVLSFDADSNAPRVIGVHVGGDANCESSSTSVRVDAFLGGFLLPNASSTIHVARPPPCADFDIWGPMAAYSDWDDYGGEGVIVMDFVETTLPQPTFVGEFLDINLTEDTVGLGEHAHETMLGVNIAPRPGVPDPYVIDAAEVSDCDPTLPRTRPDHAWHNADDPYDVNGDGFVSGSDVLLVYRDVQENGRRQVSETNPNPGIYLDVNNDGYVTQTDVLAVYREAIARRTQ